MLIQSPMQTAHVLFNILFAAFLLMITNVGHVLAEEPLPAISVSATGSATVAPDTAIVSLGVQAEAKTARDALSRNNEAMATVLRELKAAGIEARDLQTTGFNIQPRYHYPKQKMSGEQRPPMIVGYQVFNQLSVRIRDLSKLGEILDRSVSLGINSGGGIRFINENPKAAKRKAREIAMANAFAKANALAVAANVGLGRILSISEHANQPPPRPIREMAMARASAPGAVPVAVGENSYSVSVQVRWEIKQ